MKWKIAQEVKKKLSGQREVTDTGRKMDNNATKSGAWAFEQPCPIRDVLDRIGDQWSLLTLNALEGGTLRFSDLLREINDISKQMLSKTLKHLEQDGFVTRRAYAEVPPRVEYALTPLGTSFFVPMLALVAWADANHHAICAAREVYRKKIAMPA